VKKMIVGGLAVLAFTATAPAQAEASSYDGYLTAGEASRYLGATLHSDYYVRSGSLRANWHRREARNRLYGTFTVRFQDGDLGWGTARATQWPSGRWRTYYHIDW
jgi:hypothetical protein